MYLSFVISVLLHALILFMGMVIWRFAPPELRNEAVIPIDVVTVAMEEQRILEEVPPSMEAAPQETIKAEPVVAKEEVEDINDEVQSLIQEKKKKRKSQDGKQGRLNPERLENLIDKRLKRAERKPLDTSKLAEKLEKRINRNTRIDQVAALSIQQALDSKVSQCYNPPQGAHNMSFVKIYIRFRLNEDGSLASNPKINRISGMTNENRAYVNAVGNAALRAVYLCSPYDNLPAKFVDYWARDDIELTFDPSRLM